MLMNPKVILRTDTEPVMTSLRKKVQGIRKLKNLDTELQDVSPDEHEGFQVERWKITSECMLYPWAARHAAFLLNRLVVHKGKTLFEVVFDRVQEYVGAVGKRCIGKATAKSEIEGRR